MFHHGSHMFHRRYEYVEHGLGGHGTLARSGIGRFEDAEHEGDVSHDGGARRADGAGHVSDLHGDGLHEACLHAGGLHRARLHGGGSDRGGYTAGLHVWVDGVAQLGDTIARLREDGAKGGRVLSSVFNQLSVITRRMETSEEHYGTLRTLLDCISLLNLLPGRTRCNLHCLRED